MIGVSIQVGEPDSVVRLAETLPESTAQAAGPQAGDRLLAVDGKTTAGLREDQVVKLVRGEPGTPVKLTILRDGWDSPRDFALTRKDLDRR